MKSKVLIPVDTARNSLTAEEYAIKLNWLMPMRVSLLHVLDTKRLRGHGMDPTDLERLLSSMREQAQEALKAAAEPFITADLDYEIRIEQGSPGPTICRVAEEEGFQMVIIAQSGLREWDGLLGGSVVRQVLHNCQVPVLLVKHSPEQLERHRKLHAEKGFMPF
jgi:nucleotide-binding universal stress UspA family protein